MVKIKHGCSRQIVTYQQDLRPSKKVRQRKIIWFNPPYSMNVETHWKNFSKSS